MKELFKQCEEIAATIFAQKNIKLDPTIQIQNIFAYAASDPNFNQVIHSENGAVQAELRSQIKFICELGLDTAKGRKLVYVKTRNVNAGSKQQPVWLTMSDISISYHALIHVLVRSKALNHVTVLHVYKNYEVAYSGNIIDTPIVKSWLTSPDARGEYTGCFVVLTLTNGDIETSFYHVADILKTHQAFSKSSRTWTDHKQSMVAKSAIMEAIRYIPVFDETIASVVADYDSSHEYEKEPEPEKPVLTPESKTWQNAIDAFTRDGNLKAVLKHATISNEHQDLLRQSVDSNVA